MRGINDQPDDGPPSQRTKEFCGRKLGLAAHQPEPVGKHLGDLTGRVLAVATFYYEGPESVKCKPAGGREAEHACDCPGHRSVSSRHVERGITVSIPLDPDESVQHRACCQRLVAAQPRQVPAPS
jgi:hypothetical protein